MQKTNERSLRYLKTNHGRTNKQGWLHRTPSGKPGVQKDHLGKSIILSSISSNITRKHTHLTRLLSFFGNIFQFFDETHSFQNFSKHNMFAIQVRSRYSGDEELWAVGAWTRVGHWKQSRCVMLERRRGKGCLVKYLVVVTLIWLINILLCLRFTMNWCNNKGDMGSGSKNHIELICRSLYTWKQILFIKIHYSAAFKIYAFPRFGYSVGSLT